MQCPVILRVGYIEHFPVTVQPSTSDSREAYHPSTTQQDIETSSNDQIFEESVFPTGDGPMCDPTLHVCMVYFEV